MKNTLFILWILVIIVCLIIGAVLAFKRIEGWGWFLFVAVLFGAGFSYSENDNKNKNTKRQ